ncbi:MAG: efflux RND transporter periplasmic adaptor subunit [Sphingomonadaceae bacterium]|nr:efflux RND transporter periplasmic adaptor subunit [Sphingomonadaceae bacterium]
MKSNILAILVVTAVACMLTACFQSPTAETDDHAQGAESPSGPHGGRLLRDGNFSIELTIFEGGPAPQFRAYATRDGKAINPTSVNLTVVLRRLGGAVNNIVFTPSGDFLQGVGPVEEPHSFDVDVTAVVAGQRHHWAYASLEGRTRITAAAAREGGITIAHAGPATIGDTRELFGTVALNPNARSEIRGQFPGRIVSITKNVGDRVRRGELLARIESSESLQTYPVYASVSGVVAERNGNVGDVTFDRALYVITDPAATNVEFNIFPRDLGAIRPGMRIAIETLDGQIVGDTTLSGYLPEGNRAAGTALMRASLPNRDGRWRAGMALRGRVIINAARVPLAVRTSAIQRFRGLDVVFANYGEDYEARMLELGRQTSEWTEVLSGIDAGTPYVVGGAFLVRSDIEKSGASHDH